MAAIPAWDKLGAMAVAAANRGDGATAMELGLAARDAWLNHCEAVYAEELSRRARPAHSVWIRDWERER
jgi:hypothetical protein